MPMSQWALRHSLWRQRVGTDASLPPICRQGQQVQGTMLTVSPQGTKEEPEPRSLSYAGKGLASREQADMRRHRRKPVLWKSGHGGL